MIKACICPIAKQILFLSIMNWIYCFGIAKKQQLSTWADTSLSVGCCTPRLGGKNCVMCYLYKLYNTTLVRLKEKSINFIFHAAWRTLGEAKEGTPEQPNGRY